LITKTQLPNGLTIHLKEIHTAPIISHWVWYRVGSRDEGPGSTGISHWVEHMQFKGTPTFPSSVLDKAISREGGAWNAFTHMDWTTYYETLPADKIDLALRLEADRMVNSLFSPEEVESERTVIIAEREQSENEPVARLDEAVQTAAFRVHTYGHEVIGLRDDLLKIQREDLYRHYRAYYCPSNAIVAIAGDFDTKVMLDRIEELYGNLPGSPAPAHTAPVEPSAQEEQRVEVSGPGKTTFLRVAYHAPPANHPDFFAFTVLDSMLSGPTSLNMFGGGGISNKTSRLYRALVEKELAVSVHGGLSATIDPFLYDVDMIVRPDREAEAVLASFDDQVKRLQDACVAEEEIHRAIKQARALFAYGSENITNQAFWLGYAEMFADYHWFTGYLNHLNRVTPVDVQRVAQTYLIPANRVVGIYLPTGEALDDDEEEFDDDGS
jgi:zinc protease